MDSEASGARETKILADILALALDEQPGVSTSALEAIKQRARQSGVTGGALKEAFQRAQTGGSDADERAAVSLARARGRIDALQSQVAAVEEFRRREQAASRGGLRRARLAGLVIGLVWGAALAVLVRGFVG